MLWIEVYTNGELLNRFKMPLFDSADTTGMDFKEKVLVKTQLAEIMLDSFRNTHHGFLQKFKNVEIALVFSSGLYEQPIEEDDIVGPINSDE